MGFIASWYNLRSYCIRFLESLSACDRVRCTYYWSSRWWSLDNGHIIILHAVSEKKAEYYSIIHKYGLPFWRAREVFLCGMNVYTCMYVWNAYSVMAAVCLCQFIYKNPWHILINNLVKVRIIWNINQYFIPDSK